MCKKKNLLCGPVSDRKKIDPRFRLEWAFPRQSLGNAHSSLKLGSIFFYLKPDHIKDSYSHHIIENYNHTAS